MSVSDQHVLNALEACGRDRVFHSDVQAKIAIRWESPSMRSEWIVGDGATMNAAGKAAALEFARRLDEHADHLIAWAKRIRDHADKAGT